MSKPSSRNALAANSPAQEKIVRPPLKIHASPDQQSKAANSPNPVERLRQGAGSAPPYSGSPSASPPRSPSLPEAFARAAVTEALMAAGMPVEYPRPKLLTNKQGVIITQNGLVTSTCEPEARDKTRFVLYSFITYSETERASAIFAAPVFDGFDSRHPFYTQILGLDKDKITNGGEIIFEVKPDGGMEVAFWTDKTGTFFKSMFLNHLRIHGRDSAELEKIEDPSKRALAAKEKAIAEIPSYYEILAADKFIAAQSWEDAFCGENGSSLVAKDSGAKGAAALFEQHQGVYQFREQVADLDLSQLPEEACHFITALLYRIDEEQAATATFRSLSF